MKASRAEIIEQNLKIEEFNLKQLLLRTLPDCVEKGSNIFTNSEYNPFSLPSHQFTPQAEELLKSSQKCISFRQELSLEQEHCIAFKYLKLCQENASTDEHRRGPRKLAEHLLNHIRKGT